jgi:hypothetical protein
MLRELQALYDDPKMLQYAPWGLLPKMGAGRVDAKGQVMNQNKTWPCGEIQRPKSQDSME